MKRNVKKTLCISSLVLGSLIALLSAAIGLAIHFIFTPEKLTPVVVEAANRNLNAKLDMGSVELTFFSTFPRFGLKLTDGTLVSNAIRDTLWQRSDTLASFHKAVLVINPIDYLKEQKVTIYRLALDSAKIYAYKHDDGRANWDIVPTDTTKIRTDTTATDTALTIREIDVRRIVLRHASLTFDDRETKVFANLWDVNLGLKANLRKGHSLLALDWYNKNVLFWQDGELLANRITTRLRTDIELNRATHTFALKDARLDVNGVELDLKGRLQRDSVARALQVDLDYALHAPSVETLLHMIPESILKKEKVKADGEIRMEGTLKGLYGKKKMPMTTLKIQINNVTAQYNRLPYGVDNFKADFYSQIDLMKQHPSYAELKILQFKGAHTDILADAKVTDLLGDPVIDFHTETTADLTALAQTFPLQEGVSMGGNLEAKLKVHTRLSALKKKDIGRIRAGGKLTMTGLFLHDTNKKFDFSADASLAFAGNDILGAKAEIKNMALHSRRINSDLQSLTATVKTTNPQDTTRIAHMECKLNMQRLKASMSDSINVFCGKSTATVKLQPGEHNPEKPQIGLSLQADTLFCRMGDTRMGMDKAGIGITAEKIRDSLWIPKGIVGFNRMSVRTPLFALPVRMQKTSLTVGNRAITLRNATMRIGRSDLTASGSVHDLYGAMKHHKTLRAELSLTSRNLNCNQLIRSISFPQDTLEAETDTTTTDLKLFVIPKNIDFQLQTNLKRVRYGKMLFENVHGAIDIRNQTVHLQELSMTGLGATMNTTLLYRASRPERGYAGFDFKLHRVDIGRLVDFIPSLDSIVPMLRSFEGVVDFNVAAESDLDSCLNLQIPSLRSAIQLKGDSLVLMDGETFAEISKKFFFKNKEKNMIDSIAVNISVKDGNVTVYPFVVQMDRYRAAVGGTQDLNMNFDYHISILKSPIPIKFGLNIRGNLDDMKFSIGKAKYKNAVTPVEIHKVDSTIVTMGQQIVEDFRKRLRRRER